MKIIRIPIGKEVYYSSTYPWGEFFYDPNSPGDGSRKIKRGILRESGYSDEEIDKIIDHIDIEFREGYSGIRQ